MALARIYTSRDPAEAHLLRSQLETAGIRAVVLGETLANAIGTLPLGSASAPTVWVNDDALPDAAAVVEAFEQRLAHGPLPTIAAPWVCPKCGETIEGQFTDCWNCLTARSDGTAVVPVADAEHDPSLAQDLPCLQCQYNLRGLTPLHRCPECGHPVLHTVFNALHDWNRPDRELLEEFVRQPFEEAGEALEKPASALILLSDAALRAVHDPRRDEEPETNPVAAARRICLAVRDEAIDYFGGAEEAKLGLRSWNIRHSNDIGLILRALADAGLLPDFDETSGSAIDGLFDLDQLFREEA